MNAVGILGSYISKGVYTVSAPFHPFGGAVDIVVVEQQDGRFKSAPWYVRFGKFQGVLKSKEKVVNIFVNGVEASFHMYLDHKGEAYFLREVDVEGESGSYSSSSGDDTDGKSQQEQEQDGRRMLGPKSSRPSRILGFVLGRKSMKEDSASPRIDSLERAEIAADLLEVKWSTNLSPRKLPKEETSRFSPTDSSCGKDEKNLNVHDRDSHIMRNCLDNRMGDEGCESCSDRIINGSQFAPKNLELSIEVTRKMSTLNTKDHVIETATVVEQHFKRACEVKSEISREIEQIATNAEGTVNALGIISKNIDSDSQIQNLGDRDTYCVESFNEEHLSDPMNIVTKGFSKTYYDSMVLTKGFSKRYYDSMVQTHKTSQLANGGSEIFSVHDERSHARTEVHSEDTFTSVVSEDFEIETEKLEVSKNYPQQINPCNTCVYEGNKMDQEEPLIYSDLHTQVVSTDQIHGSDKVVKFNTICSTSSSDLQDEKGVDDSVTSKFQYSLSSVGNRVIRKETSTLPSTNLDQEQLFFSDFDVSETNVSRNMESDIQHCNDEKDYPLVYPGGIKEENRFVNRNYETRAPQSLEIFKHTTRPITITRSRPVSTKRVGRLAASLPNMQAGIGSPIEHEIYHPRSYSVDFNSESLNWMKVCNDGSSSKSSEDEDLQLSQEQSKIEESQVSEEVKSKLPSPAVGSRGEALVDPVGNWKLWPFSLKRSKPRKATQSDADNYTKFDTEKVSNKNMSVDGDASIFKYKTKKKMVRSISPTSEQLASLNLKEGSNIVTFTFSTAMLGKQQVDARIYLWKWNTRIVISDVDGTITKSDVLGQFMPFVGMDWSQTGVTHLFSAIKENGYQLLFLSARSISQAYHTRQFLFNLKQDGKALPEGPVVISPDGLFPSLYREVIRRAPHEFKIACLERIRELFPPDSNPFYAGFGNRDTDEISYLKVGIPKGKIFIINPKGEVAVNRRVDTRSYTSLRTLVNGMFPPVTAFEQEEDFNSWNYWKLPPPMADI